MVPNVLYEVKVDEVSYEHNNLSLGVTRISPARLLVTELSVNLEDSVIISYTGIHDQDKFMCTSLGEGLKKIQVGSRVGVLVDSSNDLHLYIDGEDQGVVAKRVTLPCFAVFDMSTLVTKVTALLTSRMTKNRRRRFMRK